MKRSRFGLVSLLLTSVTSVLLAAQNVPPPAGPAAGDAGAGRQGGGRQGGGRQGGAPQEAVPALPPVPLVGLAQVTVKATDLDKSRKYYNGTLGFAEAFTIKDASGKVTSAYFKINDDQYIEVTPNLKPGDIMRFGRVVFESSNLELLRAAYVERGLNPSPITKGADGNPVFEVIGPSEARLNFIQIVPGSQQALARGKFLDARRLSTKLGHIGIYTQDRAVGGPFYQKIGLVGGRTARGESIDTPSSDRNIETKYPPLVDTPETHERFVRETMGATQHLGFDTDNMRATRDLAQKNGGLSDLQVRVALGNNRRWLMHLFDPDGTRSEFTETAVHSDWQAWTIMAPGPEAPNIPPTTPGQAAWPASPADLAPRAR